jgi:hypothetical protein
LSAPRVAGYLRGAADGGHAVIRNRDVNEILPDGANVFPRHEHRFALQPAEDLLEEPWSSYRGPIESEMRADAMSIHYEPENAKCSSKGAEDGPALYETDVGDDPQCASGRIDDAGSEEVTQSHGRPLESGR